LCQFSFPEPFKKGLHPKMYQFSFPEAFLFLKRKGSSSKKELTHFSASAFSKRAEEKAHKKLKAMHILIM